MHTTCQFDTCNAQSNVWIHLIATRNIGGRVSRETIIVLCAVANRSSSLCSPTSHSLWGCVCVIGGCRFESGGFLIVGVEGFRGFFGFSFVLLREWIQFYLPNSGL